MADKKVPINKKTIFWITGSIVTLVVSIYLISWITVMGGFTKLERLFMLRNISRAQEIITDMGNNMAIKLADWTAWDDTYVFIEDKNEEYIMANLADSALENINIDMMIFIKLNGDLIYFKEIFSDKEASLLIPEELKKYLAKGSFFLEHENEQSSIFGIVMMPRGPLMVVSRPIITTERTGPIRGSLLFTKYIDTNELKRLSNIIRVDVDMRSIESASPPSDFNEAQEGFRQGETTFMKENKTTDTISGYSRIKDISGKPVVILKVTTPREITRFGRKVLVYFNWALLIVGVIFGMAVYIPLEREISGRRQAEKVLYEQRKILANIIEGTNLGTWRWNVVTGETEFNERWAEIVGYTLEELAPVSIQTWTRLAHPDDLRLSDDLLQKHFAGILDYYDLECRMRHKNGSWVYVHDCGKVVEWTRDGKPLVMTGTHEDISERKRTELELMESEKKFRAVFDAALDGMVVVDQETHGFVMANASFLQQFGYTEAESKKISISDIHLQEGLRHVLGQLEKDNKSDVLLSSELPLRRKDGTEFLADVRTSLVAFNGRQYLLSIFRDITERKQVESYALKMAISTVAAETAEKKAAEIEAAYKELQRTQNMLINSEKLASLGKLVSELAHEVNNPLMVISGNAQLALMIESIGDEQRKHIEIILNECQNAKNVITRVLRFVKPSKGEVKEVDISQSIEAVVGILEKQLKLFSNVEIKRHYSANAIHIWMDEQKMQEVYMNLLKNAQEAMPGGGIITIATSLEGECARIDFKDTGSGMSEEAMRNIIEPFFTTKESGTGIGLAVCYGIVKAHNGELRFESELGKGTTATILLPLEGNRDSKDPGYG